jgi:hypothetical protein
MRHARRPTTQLTQISDNTKQRLLPGQLNARIAAANVRQHHRGSRTLEQNTGARGRPAELFRRKR